MEPLVIFTVGLVVYCFCLTVADELRDRRHNRASSPSLLYLRALERKLSSFGQPAERFRHSLAPRPVRQQAAARSSLVLHVQALNIVTPAPALSRSYSRKQPQNLNQLHSPNFW